MDVQDPQTGSNFRFYDFEYELALQLNGQPFDDVVAWAASSYGLELTAEGVEQFAGRLAELGFLETAGADIEPAPVAAPSDPGGGAPEPAENVEREWSEAQSARTTQYVPDRAMLAEGQDRTPAVPPAVLAQAVADHDTDGHGGDADETSAPAAQAADFEIEPRRDTVPGMMAEGPTAPVEVPSAAWPRSAGEGSAATELPVESLTELPPSGPVAIGWASRSAPPPDMPSWAKDLDGTLGGEAPGAASALAGNGPMAPARATPPPVGMQERRQPPSPDAVAMVPVEEDTGRQFRAPPPERGGRSTGRAPIFVAIAVAVLAAGGGFYYWMRHSSRAPEVPQVHVVAPKPTAVYRWFSTVGAVINQDIQTLAFDSAGRVAEMLPPGTHFTAGETLGKLQGTAALETDLGRYRSRLAFYQQMRDSMKAAGNQGEAHQAESKIAEKQKLVDEADANLKKLLLVAPEPGEISEALAKVGAPVVAKAPALKWKGHSLHGDFTLDEQDFATAGKLGFCRVEVTGLAPAAASAPAAGDGAAERQGSARFVDCKLPPLAESPPSGPGASPLRKFSVELPSDVGLVVGQPLRLARLRYDAVFPLPAAAVVHTDGGDKVWVVSPQGVAEARTVAVAEARDEVLVSGGLRVGDEVIVDPPAELHDGQQVAPQR